MKNDDQKNIRIAATENGLTSQVQLPRETACRAAIIARHNNMTLAEFVAAAIEFSTKDGASSDFELPDAILEMDVPRARN